MFHFRSHSYTPSSGALCVEGIASHKTRRINDIEWITINEPICGLVDSISSLTHNHTHSEQVVKSCAGEELLCWGSLFLCARHWNSHHRLRLFRLLSFICIRVVIMRVRHASHKNISSIRTSRMEEEVKAKQEHMTSSYSRKRHVTIFRAAQLLEPLVRIDAQQHKTKNTHSTCEMCTSLQTHVTHHHSADASIAIFQYSFCVPHERRFFSFSSFDSPFCLMFWIDKMCHSGSNCAARLPFRRNQWQLVIGNLYLSLGC